MIEWRVAALARDDRALWDAMGAATPAYSPMPTPGAPNELPAVEVVCRAIGTPLLPWQRWAVRVITEKRADDPRRYRHPDVTVTVERQSGKTTVVRGVLLTRAMIYRHRSAFYTAQTGKDATERWSDLVQRVERSALKSGIRVRKAIGTQRMVVVNTESRLSPFAPTSESLHGYTPHDVAVDELFSFDDAQGNDLQGAIKPAQQTLPDRQVIWLSTAGHAGSTFLRSKVDAGRLANLDPASSLGYLEWSLDPQADPYDEANWPQHPAFGHLIGAEDLRELAESVPEGEWRRAFWNQWVEAVDPVFDMGQWAAGTRELEPPSGDVVLGYALDAARTSAAVVAAWETPDGKLAVRPVWLSPDVDALPGKVVELQRELRPVAVVADNGGLTRVALDVVQARAAEAGWSRAAVALTPAEWVIASASIVGKLAEGRLVHDGAGPLTDAVRRVLTRRMGEAWAISHNSPAPVIAMAAALRGLDSQRASDAPMIYLGPEG